MPRALEFLSRPNKSNDDYFEFHALSGGLDAFDRMEAEIIGCGQETSRADEVLYRTNDDRWVLIYAPYQDENDPTPLPAYRELSPSDAARWFRLNEKALPKGLKPVALRNNTSRERGRSRLDRAWAPADYSPISTSVRNDRLRRRLEENRRKLERRRNVRQQSAKTVSSAPKAPVNQLPPRDLRENRGGDQREVSVSGRENDPPKPEAGSPSSAERTSPIEAPIPANPIDSARKLKQPSESAIQAYRLRILRGQKQVEIAKQMSAQTGRRITQGTISRHINQVRKWLEAGNILPELPGLTKKPISVDPSKLDMDRRRDGRVPRQRPIAED